jgi:DNA-binding NarL/FixJ family response regulator
MRAERRISCRVSGAAQYWVKGSAAAGAFAGRARIELRAAGERAPGRAAQTRDALTAREAQIARLAGQGASNAEIAAQLYISSAAVAHHVRKVFTTLGISSRSQLARALPPEPD